MNSVPQPVNEAARLQCLQSLDLLDTASDPALDAITEALARQLGCEIVLVTLLDGHRQWFKAHHGLAETETPRDLAICAHTILGDHTLVVPDTLADPRFATNALVTSAPFIRFYAGQPLWVQGHKVGALCVISTRPGTLSEAQLSLLSSMAQAVQSMLEREAQLLSLHAQDQRLKVAAQNLPGAIFQLLHLPDGGWRCAYGAQAMAQLLALPEAELGGDVKPIFGLVHPDDRDAVGAAMALSAQRLTPFREGCRVQLPGRGLRWLETHATPQRQPDGGLLWHGFVTDITGRKQIEQELAQTQQRLQLAKAATRLGLLQIDLVAGQVALDAVAADDHGLRGQPVSLDLKDWLALVAEADRQQLEHCLTQGAAQQRQRQVYGLGADMAGRRIELQVEPGPGQGELLAVCRDVTLLDRAEQLQRNVAQAESSRREHNSFLSRVSHELRTPMNAILGFTHLLRNDPHVVLADHQQRWLDQVQQGGRHLLALIDDVLELSRATHAPHSLQPVPVDLQAALAECLNMLQALAQTAGVSLLAPPESSPCWVMADRRGLRQTLINVLGNAVKFNRPGGQVRCRILPGSGPGQWQLQIEDDGPGIPASGMARLFMPFERLGADASAVSGTGLGLAIAKEMTEAMGGTIEARCPAEGGTCMTLSLPAASPAPAGAAPAAQAPAGPPARAGASRPGPAPERRWLAVYVEDDAVNAQLMSAVFDMLPDRKLLVLDQPGQLLPLLRQQAADLLLLDLHLPQSSGFELLRQLRADKLLAGLRSIAVSADAMPATVSKVRRAGFDDFWPKPLDLDLLLQRLALEAQRLQQTERV